MLTWWFLSVCIILVICYIIILVFKDLKDKFWVSWYVHKLPGPPSSNWFMGSAPHLYGKTPEQIFTILREWGLKYYPVYMVSATPVLAAVKILCPEDFELILADSKHNEKGLIYKVVQDWLGFGLITSGGETWATRRKILTPTFHFNILRQFVSVINNATNSLIDEFKANKEEVQIEPITNKYTLKVIAETAMGANIDFNNKAHYDYKKAIIDISQIFIEKALKPWLIIYFVNIFTINYHKIEKTALKILHNFTRTIIEERKRNFVKADIKLPKHENDEVYEPKKRLAMLDLLFSIQKEEGSIDDAGICEEVDTIMFAGHDTTATSLSFTLMLIASHLEIQSKILNEMEEVLGDIKKKPTFNELQQLNYLERCIKESLRLCPSVPIISRKLGSDLTTASGYKLLKGTIAYLHIYDLHHNPNVWPNPKKYDPDRFLPENCQKRHSFAFVPFSAGPRNCIGQKFAFLVLKAAICSILANFKLEAVDTLESITFSIHLILKTKSNMRIRFIPR